MLERYPLCQATFDFVLSQDVERGVTWCRMKDPHSFISVCSYAIRIDFLETSFVKYVEWVSDQIALSKATKLPSLK